MTKSDIHSPNLAEAFIGALIMMRNTFGPPARAAHAYQGTPPRLHKRIHSRWVPGDQFIQGRFRRAGPLPVLAVVDLEVRT